MDYLSADTFRFLADLGRHNDRAWFNDNKPRYEEARADFESFIRLTIAKIGAFDAEVGNLDAKDCVMRIYRDTRFAKDKTPYKTNLAAHMVAGGRRGEHARAGYYLHIAPGGSFLAGGAHLPPARWIAGIRLEIDANAGAFRKILAARSFKSTFGEMEGETLKTAPKGYAKDHPDIDLLRYKSFLAVHSVSDNKATAKGFLAHTAKVFKALQPFDDFLNRRSG